MDEVGDAVYDGVPDNDGVPESVPDLDSVPETVPDLDGVPERVPDLEAVPDMKGCQTACPSGSPRRERDAEEGSAVAGR